VKEEKMSEKDFEKTISLLEGVLDYESFKEVDMVIEVVEFTMHVDFFVIAVYSETGEESVQYLLLMLGTGSY